MFQETQKRRIDELQATLVELVHPATGAQVMHLATEDEENLFAVCFKTLPSSSNGVPHVLEHTVLCGSKKFPVKDPFFSMARRSLATYMNALTGSDFTIYPAASENKKDFYNLFSVYLDSLFHPLLRAESFQQERGIVYNEMKGALSTMDARMWKAMMRHLFPTNGYGFNSGGDPEEVATLTHEQLLQFWKEHYHPSRALFFFYGNIPLEEHLQFLEEQLLRHAEKIPPAPLAPLQPPLPEPTRAQERYPIGADEDASSRYALILGWLTSPLSEPTSWLALQLLDVLLFATDASPFKKRMLESGLVAQVECAIDPEIAQMPFTIVLKGIEEKNLLLAEQKARAILEEIVKEGFAEEKIEAALHQLELSRSEITGGSYPFGLSLCFRSALLKMHGLDPKIGLGFHELIDALRSHLKDASFLTAQLQTWLIDNPSRVCLQMIPDAGLHDDEESTDPEKETTESSDNSDCLPKIALSDVNPHGKDLFLAPAPLRVHECFTNGLLYLCLSSPLPALTAKELVLAKWIAQTIGEVGTKTLTFNQVLDQQMLFTGGISAEISLFIQANDPQTFYPRLLIRTKGLTRNRDALLKLFEEVALTTRYFEPDRLSQLLRQQLSSLENNLVNNAMRYAVAASCAPLSPPLAMSWQLSGLPWIEEVRTMIATPIDQLMKDLNAVCEKLLGSAFTEAILSAEKTDFFEGLLQHCHNVQQPFVADLPTTTSAINIPAPVSYNAFSIPAVPYTHPAAAPCALAAQIMEHLFLHPEVREKGGAYGASASARSPAGCFTFSSYRDPHVDRTKQAFLNAAQRTAQGDFSTQDIEEAKLAIIQTLDTPIPPGARAESAYAWEKTARTFASREEFRRRLLKATKEEVVEATKDHILSQWDKGHFISYGR